MPPCSLAVRPLKSILAYLGCLICGVNSPKIKMPVDCWGLNRDKSHKGPSSVPGTE